MIGQLAALILLSTVSWTQTAEVSHLISLTVVELGGSVTFECQVSDMKESFSWYKQPLGHMAQNVAAAVHGKLTVSKKFKDTRFTLREGDDQCLLTIRNVSKEDEATYFCQSGTGYLQVFNNGTFLSVNDHKQQKHVYVHQSPETASVQLGASMTLQCSLLYTDKESRAQCPGEHSVHWFRAGSGGFHPSIIYTHSNRSDEQEERSCVYSLSKTIQNSSDAGTYYCAVVTCGEILFGEGTKVETRSELEPVVLVLGGLLVCCVAVVGILIYYINQRTVCEHCKGAMSFSHHHGHDESTVDQSNDLDGEEEAVNYAALDFSARRVKRGRKKRESPQECVYSVTYYHNQQNPSL
ncbi:uncharacterized protein LOC130174011 [Seriola aureovittata]|uniref:uncharacterized protein LOC130174011 n=1 Tax=Seriola aureovittata TaxID=2871759 RepID=UPI0024BE862F|nr:uncharacterized protein LOC130174011 [Seriola aureovittata]